MKKFLCIIFALIICLSLASCAAKNGGTENETNGSVNTAVDEIAEIEKALSEKNSEFEKSKNENNGSEATVAAVDKSEWINAYKNVLLNLDKEDIELNDQSPKFCLCYIDGDSIPELAVSSGDFHAACCYLYTYANGKAVNLGPFGSFGQIQFIEKRGIIIDRLGNNGYFVESYYKLDNGILDSLLEFEIETREDEIYMVDGKEITKTQYDSLVSKITNGSKPVSSPEYEKCFAINEESIEKNLK